jgi:ligand-binding SRPBCC domain-containing protein
MMTVSIPWMTPLLATTSALIKSVNARTEVRYPDTSIAKGEGYRRMKEHLLESDLWLPRPLDEVFSFFADARNLQKITPPWLDFAISTPGEIVLQKGALIDYKLRVRGIPLRWRSEITVWEPPRRFVDTQLRGPYRLWNHEHRFEERDGGTLVNDEVRYSVYGGEIIRKLFVARDVDRIFSYRTEKLRELFGSADPRRQE